MKLNNLACAFAELHHDFGLIDKDIYLLNAVDVALKEKAEPTIMDIVSGTQVRNYMSRATAHARLHDLIYTDYLTVVTKDGDTLHKYLVRGPYFKRLEEFIKGLK